MAERHRGAKRVIAGIVPTFSDSSAMKTRMQRCVRALLMLTAFCSAVAAHADPVASDADAREQRLERHVDELARELQAVRAELQALKAQYRPAAAARVEPPAWHCRSCHYQQHLQGSADG
jgi:hypothetical protein